MSSAKDSPEDKLLPRRESGIFAASSTGSSPLRRPFAASSTGSSPRRRWSPRLSPSFLRRNQYTHLKVSPPSSPGNEGYDFKENASPLTELSMDGIPVPRLSGAGRGVLETPPSVKQAMPSPTAKPSLPSPSPRARFTLDTVKQSSGSKVPLSTGSGANVKRKQLKVVKASLPQQQQSTRPIFRFDVQALEHGTEAVLSPRDKDESKSNDDGNDKGSFSELVNAKSILQETLQTENSGTALHDLCANIATLDDLMRAKSFLVRNQTSSREGTNNAAKTDYKGRTPMHVFSDNKVLASAIGIPSEFDVETREYLRIYHQPTFDPESNLERHVTRFLVTDLLSAYPGAMMIRDDDGHIPFESALKNWVDAINNDQESADAGQESSYLPGLSSYTTAVARAWESTSSALVGMAGLGGNNKPPEYESTRRLAKMPLSPQDVERGKRRPSEGTPKPDESAGYDCSNTSDTDQAKRPATRRLVRLTPHVRFTIMMLSAVVDQLEHYTAPELAKSKSARMRSQLGYESRESTERAWNELLSFRQNYGSVDIIASVVQIVASIPDFMQTLLMVADDGDREFALSSSIVRRVMVNRHSVGPWLTAMLQSRDKKVSRRSVDYLRAVSKECTSDGDSQKTKTQAKKDSSNARLLIDEMSRLPQFIPALLSLGDRGIEEASTTFVVRRVLDRLISRPFTVTVVLCDALFLALMIVGFRSAVNGLILGRPLEIVLQWIYVSNTGIFYFIIREVGKTVSLFLISKRARAYFLSFWNLIDVTATFLALSSTILMRYHFTFQELGLENASFIRGLLAVTTGFLWLRVLSLLKAINMQLATFVLAILQITKDILWFCVILLALVVSFAQMFFTLLTPSSCASIPEDAQECSETEYLLRAYTVLLGDFGDFDREHFDSGFSVFLVVLYSFLVTVVLLNVLIAVASDSYEKCLLRSQNLFGRARVMLLAELVSFQNLLKRSDDDSTNPQIFSKWWTSQPWNQGWSRGSVLFFCLSTTVTAGWTVAELLGYSRGERHGDIIFSLASVAINVALFAAIMIFLATGSAPSKRELTDEDYKKSDGCLQRMMLRLLGSSGATTTLDGAHHSYADGGWNGRVNYLQHEMTRIAEEQTTLATDLSRSTEALINFSEQRLRTEMTSIEESFNALKISMLEEVKGTKETNRNVTIAVEELKTLISMAASTSAYRSPVPSEVKVNNHPTKFVRHDTDSKAK